MVDRAICAVLLIEQGYSDAVVHRCIACNSSIAQLTGWIGGAVAGQLVPEPEPEPEIAMRYTGSDAQSGAMKQTGYDPINNQFYPWVSDSVFYDPAVPFWNASHGLLGSVNNTVGRRRLESQSIPDMEMYE